MAARQISYRILAAVIRSRSRFGFGLWLPASLTGSFQDHLAVDLALYGDLENSLHGFLEFPVALQVRLTGSADDDVLTGLALAFLISICTSSARLRPAISFALREAPPNDLRPFCDSSS